MRLLTPSPGEVLDRMTILELKIKNGQRKDMKVEGFEAERQALRDYMVQFEQGLKEDFSVREPKEYDKRCQELSEKKNGLMAMNALLWDAEDQVRVCNQLEMTKLAGLCLRIVKLNDNRARIVRELSILYGTEDHQEKMYVTT